MELLDRYLQVVGRFLPVETKADTLAELRAHLLETMDDRAETMGRPLTDGEVSAVLKAHGKPEAVAMRYLPQRSLIGPTVFPFYIFTLRRALPFVAAIYALAQTMALVFGPAPRHTLDAIGAAILQFIPVLLTFWAVVTLVFALLERAGKAMPWEDDWDPAKLPRVEKHVPGEQGKSMPARVFELVIQVVAVAYFLMVPSHPFLIIGPGAAIMRMAPLTDTSRWLYTGILALMVAQVVLRSIGLRPRGRQTDAALTIGVKVLSIATIALAIVVKVYFVPRGSDPDMAYLVALTNHFVNMGFRIVLALSSVDLLWEIWKAARHGTPFPVGAGRVSL